MADFLRPIIDRLAAVEARVRRSVRLSWATVTSVSPVKVQMDGSGDPLDGAPDSVVAGLLVGDRVLVARQGSQVIILGRGGG